MAKDIGLRTIFDTYADVKGGIFAAGRHGEPGLDLSFYKHIPVKGRSEDADKFRAGTALFRQGTFRGKGGGVLRVILECASAVAQRKAL